MRNTYLTLDALKSTGGLNITGTAYDSRLLILLENISRQVDRYTNRVFYPWSGTQMFSGDGSTLMLVPDLISVTSIKEDENEDGTFEVTWAGSGIGGTDFFLTPFQNQPSSTIEQIAKPFTGVVVNSNSNGTQDEFIYGMRNYEIVGTWGYSHVQRDFGNVTSGSIAASGSITLTTAGTAHEAGQLLLIDSEWIYVKGVTTGTLLNVDRGVNGSSPTVHASGTAVLQIIYPGPVQEAVRIQSARLWKRNESAFSNLVGMDQTGQIAVFQGGLDGDVKALLQPYKKFTI